MEDEKIDREAKCWIPRTINTRERETKYAKTLDLYWHTKACMGQVLKEKSLNDDAISTKLDNMQNQLKIMDIK